MVNDNWLLSYAEINGIKKVLSGMNKRTGRKSHMNLAVKELNQYYNEFKNEFELFFKDAIEFSKTKIEEIEVE